MVRKPDVYNRVKRKKIAVLNEKAFLVYKAVKKARQEFDFSRYVSECLIRDFQLGKEDYLIYCINQKQDERNKIEAQITALATQVGRYRNKELEVKNIRG